MAALVAGSVLLAVAAPTRSLVLILLAAVAAGLGHGLAFLSAQDELDSLATPDRRGEVTAAFICCVYAVVGLSVIGTGLLALAFSLPASVATVSLLLAVAAAAT